jgi:hypothetical protein
MTSGWRSIENTLAFLDTLEGMFGRIDGIPLKLYREPYETTRTGKDGKRQKQVHHCIRLDVAASLLDVRRLQLAGGQDLALPEPPVECADDMYPQSLQAVEAAALPPVPDEPAGVVIESPPLAAVPAGIEDDPVYQEMQGGFDILDTPMPERVAMLYQWRDDTEGLTRHLGNLIDAQLVPVPPKTQPARAPRYDQEPQIEAPAKPKRGPMF